MVTRTPTAYAVSSTHLLRRALTQQPRLLSSLRACVAPESVRHRNNVEPPASPTCEKPARALLRVASLFSRAADSSTAASEAYGDCAGSQTDIVDGLASAHQPRPPTWLPVGDDAISTRREKRARQWRDAAGGRSSGDKYPALSASVAGDHFTTRQAQHTLVPEDPPSLDLLAAPSPEGWEAVLTSTSLAVQLQAVQRAEEVAIRFSLAGHLPP
ncbi:hypothetical protein HPB51_021132 [Rhipicephalus microplus]|uniref:Uncharacterized protein n=1 Tax=Rhipicephalus microplus TaxID=6941 RepID=A0A9J6DXN3_RHIMP|nr:hypothetical protein HPB51_021132 [Rhipicephalus microplus]